MYDYDRGSKDDFLGEMKIPLQRFIGVDSDFCWYPLDGNNCGELQLQVLVREEVNFIGLYRFNGRKMNSLRILIILH